MRILSHILALTAGVVVGYLLAPRKQVTWPVADGGVVYEPMTKAWPAYVTWTYTMHTPSSMYV